MPQITVLRRDGKLYVRLGLVTGPHDGENFSPELMATFREVNHLEKGICPSVNGDWFTKDWPFLPGKPQEPGAYWILFSHGWRLAEVFEAQGSLWYSKTGHGRPAPLRGTIIRGYLPIETPEDC
jgi:hypothetical protein